MRALCGARFLSRPLAAWAPRRALALRDVKIQDGAIPESVTTITVQKVLAKVGDFVAEDQGIVVTENDKSELTINSPCFGKLTELRYSDGARITPKDVLAIVDDAFAAEARAALKRPGSGAAAAAPSSAAPAPATPPPAAAPAAAAAPPPPPPPPPARAPLPELQMGGAPAAVVGNVAVGGRRVRVSEMRRRIAQRLKASQHVGALLTTFQEVDMTEAMRMRDTLKDEFEKKHGVRLGFMSTFVAAATRALQAWPIVNAYWLDDEIEYHDYVDISVAVSTPTGLVVPVLRGCESMGFADIEKAIHAFGKRATEGKLAPQDMQGGTFTISNGGVFGSLFGTPIVNPPQSAILGMHSIVKKPVAMPDGSVAVRPIMVLAVTYDHRIIDGRDAVSFLATIKRGVENPHRLLLGV